MKFSVIVPVYNVENYLEACISSVIAQSCRDYELILVDDGSTDSSGVLCDRLAEQYHCRVIHQENGGLGAARNTGIEAAQGDYLFFLDSDDFISNENLFRYQAKIIRELAATRNCVIVGRCANFILRGRDNVLNVFVTAPVVDCVRRVMETDGLNLEEAEKKIKKIDKRRADYFKYFTGRQWQDAALYDLCLNTGHMSEQKCVDIVRAYMDARFE